MTAPRPKRERAERRWRLPQPWDCETPDWFHTELNLVGVDLGRQLMLTGWDDQERMELLLAVIDYDFHPPDDLRLFVVQQAGVLRFDDQALVIEARHGDVVLRHYAFGDHWFKINCTTDLSGEFVETSFPGGSPFAFNCDIATPMLREGNAVFAVDLWMDVLVNQDGATYRVGDEDELTEAIARRWLSEREERGARSGLAELLSLIERGELVGFLSRVHPFGPSSAPEAIPVRRVPPTEAPLLQPHVRPTWG